MQISELRFEYKSAEFSLQIPALQVTQGELVGIVGPSGSGKTTLLHLISGILVPQQGSIIIGEKDVASLSDADRRTFRREHIGLVFQDFELIEYLNVLDNVLLPRRISGTGVSPADRQQAQMLLTDAGLGDFSRRPVTRLSQGERQRVAICRALLNSPSILLADEPTGNLDPVTSDRIMQLLLKSSRHNSTTLMMVTHDHSLLHHFDRTVDFSDFLISRSADRAGASS